MSMPFDSAVTGPSDQETMTDPNSPPNAEPCPHSDSHRTNASSGGFYSQVAPQALGYAMSIVRQWADAEEIVQEAFCRLLQSNPTHTNESADLKRMATSDLSHKPRFFAIVRNLAIDQLRRNGRRRFEPIDSHTIAGTPARSDDTRLAQLEFEIQNSLKQMPSQWSDSLQLKINGKLSYAEISDVLDATHAQVRTWIFRARKQLASDLVQKGLLEGQPND